MGLLSELLKAYVTSGWLFALGHLCLLAYIALRIQAINREALLLRGWQPEATATHSNDRPESLKTLDRFVAECRDLGPGGFLVPVTDSSDRLDSMVEGKLAELFSLINMMLIIGIAGSLFGLFEFALSSSLELRNLGQAGANASRFSELLSASMAKAFPVGFVGLVLMLFLQVVAAWPESALRRGVSEAIGRAVDERRRVSRSQANIVQQAVEQISLAMRPLENLESTLREMINPVVAEFGAEMKRSHEFFTHQFEDLTGATKTITRAVEGVEANVVILERASEALGQTLREAPAVIRDTTKTQEKHLGILAEFEETLREARVDLKESIGDLESRIDLVITSYRTALLETQEKIAQYARSSVEQTQDRVSQSVTTLDSLLERSARLQAAHQGALEESVARIDTRVQEMVGSLSSDVRTELTLTLRQLTADAKAGTEELLGGVDQSVQAIAGVSQAAGRSLVALELLPQRVSEGIQTAMEGLRAGLHEQVEALLGAASSRIEEGHGLVERLDAKIPELEVLMRTFIQNTQSTANQLADQVVGKWLEVSEGFSQNLLKATKSLEAFSNMPKVAEVQVTQTLVSLQQQLKRDLAGTWASLLNDTQAKLMVQLDAMGAGAKDVGNDLREAAVDWHRTAREVARAIEDPIRESVEKANDQLQTILARLDQAIAERLPAVVRDIERFSVALSQVTERQVQIARMIAETPQFSSETDVAGSSVAIPGRGDSDSQIDIGVKPLADGDGVRQRDQASSENATPWRRAWESLWLWFRRS